MSSAKRIIIFGLVLFVDARIRRGQSWVNKKKRPIKAAIFYLIVHYSFKTVFKTKYSFGILIFFFLSRVCWQFCIPLLSVLNNHFTHAQVRSCETGFGLESSLGGEPG